MKRHTIGWVDIPTKDFRIIKKIRFPRSEVPVYTYNRTTYDTWPVGAAFNFEVDEFGQITCESDVEVPDGFVLSMAMNDATVRWDWEQLIIDDCELSNLTLLARPASAWRPW